MLKQDIKNKDKINKRIIKIDKKLLNKYTGFTDIVNKEKFKRNLMSINYNIPNDLNNMKLNDIKKLAIKIFNQNHNKRGFVNKNNYIIVSNAGINESVEKIYNNYSQRVLLREHLMVFSKLGLIINRAKLLLSIGKNNILT